MSKDVKALVQAINAFTIDLYSALKEEGQGNLFLSPFNIATALAMLLAGARGDTEQQIAQVLHSKLSQNQLHKAFGQLLRKLKTQERKAGFRLQAANAVWGPASTEFLVLLKDHYEIEVPEVDFRDPGAAAKIINKWIAEHTGGKITDLVQKQMLAELVGILLTSCIYFKANWQRQFPKDRTRDSSFTLLSGKQVTVPTMRNKGRYNYTKTNSFKALELTYAGETLSMIILLPLDPKGLPALEKRLTMENLDEWISRLSEYKLDAVALPRFKITTKVDLRNVLQSLGMTHTFNAEHADLSGITGQQGSFITQAIHQTYVDVNEEGTEASAATVIAVKLNGNPTFYASHPFLFLIRDSNTGSILFIGRVMDPRSES
jgi:serpin B